MPFFLAGVATTGRRPVKLHRAIKVDPSEEGGSWLANQGLQARRAEEVMVPEKREGRDAASLFLCASSRERLREQRERERD